MESQSSSSDTRILWPCYRALCVAVRGDRTRNENELVAS
jgi:hypothetical protein